MLLSIVIPVYNRRETVSSSIDSVLECFSAFEDSFEIVVVDDCSTDGSIEAVRSKYAEEIDGGKIVALRLDKNRGVCGARNAGLKVSGGDWALFLDSDDTLIPDAGEAILSQLRAAASHPVVFFRCLDEAGNKVGTLFSENEQYINLSYFLEHTSHGECLVAIQRRHAPDEPFVEVLRGYEGLTIARILSRSESSAVLSPVIARIYDQRGNERLSSRTNFIRRMPLIAKGHFSMAKEFGGHMGFVLCLKYVAKGIIYICIGTAHRILERKAKC